MKNHQEDMTVEQAAKFLRISRSSVNRAARANLIPSYYRGVVRVFLKRDLEYVAAAMKTHGKQWPFKVPWAIPLASVEVAAQLEFSSPEQSIQPGQPIIIEPSSSKENALRDMVKTLKSFNEMELAQAVCVRLVELM